MKSLGRSLMLVLALAVVAFGSEELPMGPVSQGEVRFAVIGDAGTGGKNQYRVARRLSTIQRKTEFNLILFLGDNIYENGSPKDIEKKFLKPYADLINAGVEFRGVIGNHDARSKHGVLLQKLIFRMGANTFYKFGKGNGLIDFFGLNSTLIVREKRAGKNEVQMKWFSDSLKQSRAPWKIVFMHHPVFSSAKRHGERSVDVDDLERTRRFLLPRYKEFGVNLSLNGHDHVYERTKPQDGVHYFTSGAGAKLRKGDLQRGTSFFARGNDRVRSFMLYSVKEKRIRFWAIDVEGKVIDCGEIVRE